MVGVAPGGWSQCGPTWRGASSSSEVPQEISGEIVLGKKQKKTQRSEKVARLAKL